MLTDAAKSALREILACRPADVCSCDCALAAIGKQDREGFAPNWAPRTSRPGAIRFAAVADVPRAFSPPLYGYQNEGGSAPLELMAPSDTGLGTSNAVSSVSTSPRSGSRATFTIARRSL